MPPIFRFYLRQVVIGFALAAILVATLLWLNTGNLWHLVTHSDVGVLAVGLLWVFNGLVLSGAQFGVAVMLLTENDKPPGGRQVPVLVPVPQSGRQRQRNDA